MPKYFSDIQDELKEHNLPQHIAETLADDEKFYLYFKIHDLDGNNKLDGLEIFYSVTHHSQAEQHDKDHGSGQFNYNGTLMGNKLSDVHIYDEDESVRPADFNFNHIVGKHLTVLRRMLSCSASEAIEFSFFLYDFFFNRYLRQFSVCG